MNCVLYLLSHPLCPSPGSMCTCRFIANLLSDHHMPSSSSVSSCYVNLLSTDYRPLVWSSHPSSFSVSRWYVNLSVHRRCLIISSHPLYPSSGRTWTCRLLVDLSYDHPIPPSLSVFRGYVNLPIDRRPLIWLSRPTLFVCLQWVRELVDWPQTFHLISNHTILFSSSTYRKYVNLSIDHRPLVWSSHPILFVYH